MAPPILRGERMSLRQRNFGIFPYLQPSPLHLGEHHVAPWSQHLEDVGITLLSLTLTLNTHGSI